jgi:serine/threonine protein kinase
MTSMVETGVISGQKSGWSLIKKLGEGDAGEVYLVESLVDSRSAILKRPARSVFTGEVRRQAEQIRTEGRILKALGDILDKMPDPRVGVPALLDQSKAGSEFGERFFIVIDRAKGFDLSALARASRMGLGNPGDLEYSRIEAAFLEEIARQGQLPERIILSALAAVLTVFEAVHNTPIDTGSGQAAGILWNDVKPDHLFWDPHTSSVTIIDWGNGRFLEEGGITRDMRHTATGDRRQFLEEMGRFLAQSLPDLQARLEWPAQGHIYEDVSPLLSGLRERIESALAQTNRLLRAARSQEADLLQPGLESGLDLPLLEDTHRRIVALGEIPDYPAALRLVAKSAANLAAAGDMGNVRELSAWAAGLPGAPVESLRLLTQLAQIAARSQGEPYNFMVEAVQHAAAGNWEETLWSLLSSLHSGPEPDWWNDILPPVRRLAAGEDVAATQPLLNLRRISLTLKAGAQQMEDRATHYQNSDLDELVRQQVALSESLREVIQNWVQVEPHPPHSMLVYSDLDPLVNEIEAALPGAGDELRRVMQAPRRQVRDILEAWGRKEFITASKGLRHLLALDPDRRRLLRSDLALQAAPDWIQRLQIGPLPGENLPDFVTGLEYEGRELRYQLGPAGWLDGSLEGLKSMRRGTWPGDLLASQPLLANEMPWLQHFEREERIQSLFHPNQPAVLPLPSIRGVRETRYGPESELAFVEPLDSWIPEARGSSARVYLATFRAGSGEQREAALKIMRMDKADYALPLFREEAQVLSVMQDVPGVTRMLECGFLWLGEQDRLPPDHNIGAIQALRGEALRIGPDSAAQFLDLLERRVREGWTPYLLIELRRREDNLLLLCDASLNRGRFLPVQDLLLMGVQICEVLEASHQRNVVYRDHKILHYYWVKENNGIFVIDWNVARYHPDGLTPLDIHMDLVQLGARGLHHILTGRTAPGALPLGPTRPEEIEQAAESYRAQWTYDDQRLSTGVQLILEQLLSGSYTTAGDLKNDLKRAYMELR